jgi:hypothetical protein
MENNLEEIKVDFKDRVKGFYTLLTNGSVICLPNNEYIVPKSVLSELAKQGIKFKVKKNE